jgi:hypothetical protein
MTGLYRFSIDKVEKSILLNYAKEVQTSSVEDILGICIYFFLVLQ